MSMGFAERTWRVAVAALAGAAGRGARGARMTASAGASGPRGDGFVRIENERSERMTLTSRTGAERVVDLVVP